MDPVTEAIVRMLANHSLKEIQAKLRPKDAKPLKGLLVKGYQPHKEPEQVMPDSQEAQERVAIKADNEDAAGEMWNRLSKEERKKIRQVAEEVGGDKIDLQEKMDRIRPLDPDQIIDVITGSMTETP